MPTFTYGSDEAGLICGFRFGPEAPPRPIGSAEAAAWLAAPPPEAGREFLWLHFNLAHAPAERWLREHGRLEAAYFEALGEASASTRIERTEEALFAVVNDVHFDFAFEPSEISTLYASVARRCMLTARKRPLRSADRLRAAVKAGLAARSPAELFEQLLRDQADGVAEVVRGIAERLDEIEDALLAGHREQPRARLGGLRRLLVRLQRLLAPEPAALFRLLQHPPAWIGPHDVEELRQCGEEFSLVVREMAALQERAKLLQEEIAARVAEQNNRTLFVLTLVTVLALPINIVAGLLGMNVGGVPLAQHPHGFWMVVALVAAVTAVAGVLAWRSRGRG